MDKENITIITLAIATIISVLSLVMLSFQKEETPIPQTQVDLAGVAEIIKATQRQDTPQIINRVNSDDIENSDNVKRQGDEQCCDDEFKGK